MKLDDFQFLLEVHRDYEFSFRGTTYEIIAEKENGTLRYYFGEKYFQRKKYEDFNDMVANVFVKDCYLRNIIEDCL
ncbi:MAG: hypothetical protein SO116_06300 [Treponema sp.]|nr:hypothetical protein [Spirochaetia bacterium]MDD7014674.1 hypothetical protein [Spirochaetales bacterium]MDY4902468.1 hypothetical protein [Treponema sp.]